MTGDVQNKANPVRPGRDAAMADGFLLRMWRTGRPWETILAEMAGLGWTEDDVRARLDGMVGVAAPGLRDLGPLDKAIAVLAGAAWQDDRAPGGFRMNGRGASAVQIIMVANARLAMLDKPKIPYPGTGHALGAE